MCEKKNKLCEKKINCVRKKIGSFYFLLINIYQYLANYKNFKNDKFHISTTHGLYVPSSGNFGS